MGGRSGRAGGVSTTHAFTGNPLDRAAVRRRDPVWLDERLADPTSRFVLVHHLRPLLSEAGHGLRIHWIRSTDGSGPFAAEGLRESAVLLGVDAEGTAHFALSVADPDAALGPRDRGTAARADFRDPRASASLLPAVDAAVVAQARSLLAWHETHRFCARCGSGTLQVDAGYARRCLSGSCGAVHFPRTDPVVIMAVAHGERLLLGRPIREPPYPEGMFSCLAGYVEPGESVEEAVRREVLEEAGIEVGRVTYHSSQPWPFTSALMLGCIAEALSERIEIDPEELEAARWFTRDETRRALARWSEPDGVRIPPPITAAHQLIAAWLDDRPGLRGVAEGSGGLP